MQNILSYLDTPAIKKYMENNNCVATVTQSFAPINPRKASKATWIGVDKILPKALKEKSLTDVIDEYFNRLSLEKDDYIYKAVGKCSESKTPNYYVYDADMLDDDVDGFIYVAKSEIENLMKHEQCFGQNKKDFMTRIANSYLYNEVYCYEKWLTGKVFDLELSTLDGKHSILNMNLYESGYSLLNTAYQSMSNLFAQIDKSKKESQ